MGRSAKILVLLAGLTLASGCGTTRMTDTQRTATEQLLVSNAIDQVVSDLDFGEMAGKPVFFDTQYLDGTVDRGYLVSTLRQQLLARGCLLQEERAKATYVIEARSGGVGTDRHAVLIGVPQMSVPAFVPGQPSQIPEIPFAKKTDQEGMAKIAVFAYNRLTGQLVWQSGVLQSSSTSKDTWVLGAGPFQQGTIRKGTEFAGEQFAIPLPRFSLKEAPAVEVNPPRVTVTDSATWQELPGPTTTAKRLAFLMGNGASDDKSKISESSRTIMTPLSGASGAMTGEAPKSWFGSTPASADQTASAKTPDASPKPAPLPPIPPNVGGQGETEPSKVTFGGLSSKAGKDEPETEPKVILDFATGFKPDG